MRPIKLLVVFLAISGVAALVLASRAQARPVTSVSAITPAMNFAYVRVEGVLAAHPILSPDGDSLSFRLRDASGEMRVNAYRAVVANLVQTKRIPMPGDRVTVEGALRVRDDEPSLTINAADSVSIAPGAATEIELPALQAARIGDKVATRGQVRTVRDVGGLRIARLRAGNAETDIVIPTQLTSVFGAPPALRVGDWVKVAAGVGEFRGARQLLPARAADIATLPSANEALRADARPIAALDKSLLGQWLTVRGVVKDVRPSRTVTRVDLQDASGEITLTMFNAWHGVPFSRTLQAGDALIASGELAEFRGALELQPELAQDLALDPNP